MNRFISRRAAALPSMETNVWMHFTPLANKYKAVNLGQGFPSFEVKKKKKKKKKKKIKIKIKILFVIFQPPSLIIDACKRALDANVTQYTRVRGHPRLVSALKQYLEPTYGSAIDADSQILISVGASEALLLCTLSTLNRGDEAMLIEPYFDIYKDQVKLAGGVPVAVRMEVGDGDASSWKLPWRQMEAAVTEKTKLLFFNNPANIPGKVFERHELEQLAEFAIKHDLLVVSDEVYDILTFDGAQHLRLAALPGMAERTITIGSAGKTFSVTGFKVGWAVANPELIDAMTRVHSNIPFCTSSTMQEAVADALEQMDETGYLPEMQRDFAERRTALVDMLQQANLKPIVNQGSYFVLADASHIDRARYADPKSSKPLDWQFCHWLTQVGGVCAIPVSSFYMDNPPQDRVFARFTFCKTHEQFKEAGKRLQALNL